MEELDTKGFCCAAETMGCSGNGVCDASGGCVCGMFYRGSRCDEIKLPWFVIVAIALFGLQVVAYPLLALRWLHYQHSIRPAPPPTPPPPVAALPCYIAMFSYSWLEWRRDPSHFPPDLPAPVGPEPSPLRM